MRPVVLLLLVVSWASPAGAEELPPPVPAEKRADAALRDVFFLDPEIGWAVGERGAIWRTLDGGRHWQLQESPTSATLASVWFADAQTGWAAGGFTHPITQRTSGVLLQTANGGSTWQPVNGLLVPALERIRFFDGRHGWALAQPSALYPSGVLRTDDGGRTFTAAHGPPAAGRLLADFTELARGLVVQQGRGVFTLTQNELAFLGPAPAADLREPRCLKVVGREAWLAGDGGLLLHSSTGGRNWQPPADWPLAGAEHVDLRTLAAVGTHLWVAGTPGSVVFHSSDGGQTWAPQRTGQSLPLAALAFADENHGWAVGALGAMLVTRDGGQSWRRCRGGERVALLGLLADPRNMPWELLARECGEEGHLSAVEFVHRRDLDAGGAAATLARRTAEALAQLGGSGTEFAWKFPLRERGLELPLDRAALAWPKPPASLATPLPAAAAPAALEPYLVRAIRLWRPEVVVTEPAGGADDAPEQAWVHRAVLNAVEQAGDARAYPEFAATLGLAPWTTKRVFAVLAPGETGTLNLNTAQLALRLGRSLADEGLAARALVERDVSPAPPARGFQLLVERSASGSGKRSLFDGLNIQPGTDTRRVLGAPVRQDLATLKQLAAQRSNVEQILSQALANTAPGTLAAQLNDLTRGLSEDQAGQVMYQLAGQYRAAGQAELAAEAYAELVERYPKHSFTEAALMWLVQYYASAEEAQRLKLPAAAENQLAHLEPARQVLAPPPGTAAAAEPSSDMKTPPATAAARWQRAVDYMRQIERTRPDLYAEPSVRFSLAAAQRALEESHDALAWAQACAAAPGEEVWRASAQAELWLAQQEPVCTKLCLRCPRVETRPKLDGRLDEPLWQKAVLIELKSAYRDDAQWPAVARLASDGEFLYLAATCRKAPGATYAAPIGARPRDANVAREDRVEFDFDIDRDFTSSFHLVLDQRGFTQESCQGDRAWNPRWFVAHTSDAATWTVEAAMPLAELAPRPPAAGDTWALGVTRVVPAIGVQSWSKPASVSPRPAAFGLLQFE